MKESRSILVTIKFSFEGPVSHGELQEAIGRALNTRQFRLVGQYTILDMDDEIMVEVPKKPVEVAAATAPSAKKIVEPAAAMASPAPAASLEPVGPVAPIIQLGPTETMKPNPKR